MPEQEPSAEGPASVSVHGGLGTQVGTGNVQNNHYGQRPPRDLSALSVRAAVTYINQLAHDEAVDLFARTLPDDLADILKVLLRADEPKVLNILADLKPRQAAELIEPLTGDFPWLAGLPEAATAIAHQALDRQWDLAQGVGGIERAPESPQGTNGYFQRYRQGHVYWRGADKETYAVTAVIAEVYLAVGGPGGELGFPTASFEELVMPDTKTAGVGQNFEGGYIDSSARGTYAISGQIGAASINGELDLDRLGFAVAPAEARGRFTRQPFEAGTVYASPAGMFEVRSDFDSLAVDCFPVSAEEEIPSTDAGRTQRFEDDNGREIAMYASSGTKARRVTRERLALYETLGGPASGLGFPMSSTTSVEGGWTQRFQHATIYHQEGRDPLAVPAETVELAGGRLGWPVSAEEPIGASDSDRIQCFENGIVTRRSGKLEMWVRP